MAWKKRKIQEKKDKLAKEEEQKKKDYKSGKQFGLSGKEMFSFNPELADDGPVEDGDAVFDSYARDDEDDENVFEYKDLDLADISMAAQEVRTAVYVWEWPFRTFFLLTGRWYRYYCA